MYKLTNLNKHILVHTHSLTLCLVRSVWSVGHSLSLTHTLTHSLTHSQTLTCACKLPGTHERAHPTQEANIANNTQHSISTITNKKTSTETATKKEPNTDIHTK